jgi:hypothetical protein
VKEAAKTAALLAAAPLMLASCVDTIILPDDKTVDEDFWKSKSDVQLMVNGAYKSMISDAVITRLIVWGGLRSDEIIPNTKLTGQLMEDLRDINLANTQPDNQFAKWDAIYSVINNCNIVLERAAAVMREDPSYTEGDYQADCSQMRALRSLCYFYLVRNFRDVPYSATAYMNDSQDRNIPQSAPAEVLQRCIDDLIEAEQNAISSGAYTDWRSKGYMTRDVIQALLADIYLWRASVMHSASDYEQAIAYADRVIESKKAQHLPRRGEQLLNEFPLAEGNTAFSELFVSGNAEESIFELQINGANNPSEALQQYYRSINNNNSDPYLFASDIFKDGGVAYPKPTSGIDYRALNNFWPVEQTVDEWSVYRMRKYVTMNTSTGTSLPSEAVGHVSNYERNWIVYRLTDIMLMKAEALTGLALLTQQTATTDTTDYAHLRQAFALVQTVNARSLQNKADSMVWNTYSKRTTEDFEKLVLAERLRELPFEGKRWYDLMRYNYRHVSGVDYSTILADQPNLVANYTEMLNLMKRKLGSKGDAVASKTANEARLYLPVPLADLKISPLWKQNPAYSSDDTFSKN